MRLIEAVVWRHGHKFSAISYYNDLAAAAAAAAAG